MKRISPILLFSILLTACASATPIPAETSTVMSTLVFTNTPLPTLTKETTATLVVQETADLIRTVGEFPLLDYSDANLVFVEVQIDSDVDGGENISLITFKDNIDHGSDYLTASTVAALYERYYSAKATTLSDKQRLDYRIGVLTGNREFTTFPYTTSDGDKVVGSIDKGFLLQIKNSESFNQNVDKNVHIFFDTAHTEFKYKVLAPNSKGQIVIQIGVETLGNLSTKQIMQMLLNVEMALIHQPDVIDLGRDPLAEVASDHLTQPGQEFILINQ